MSSYSNKSVFVLIAILGVLSFFVDKYYYPNWLIRDSCKIDIAERVRRWQNLEKDLPREIFGQHIAVDTVLRTLYAHITNENPQKALVLSFHGSVGNGKTYMSQLIAKHLYDGRSEVTSFVGPLHFLQDSSKLVENKDWLKKSIEKAARNCDKGIFIFDEVDKMPAEIFDVIVPFLDYYDAIDGVDYRGLIFLFLSNTGAKAINQLVYDVRTIGKKSRESITIDNFRDLITEKAFTETGGLFQSEIISKRLIDYHIPFLPLEKEHILMCARRDIVRKRIHFVTPETVAEKVKFNPKVKPLLAEDGCKRILSIVSFYETDSKFI